MTKGDDMPVTWEKARLNVWHIGAVALAIASNLVVAAVIWNDTKRDIKDTQDDVSALQASVADIQKQLPQIAQLQFQVTRAVEQISENREGIKAANERMDRVTLSLGTKLDTVIDNVNKVSTQVQVLSSKFDDVQGRTDKTQYRMPVVRP